MSRRLIWGLGASLLVAGTAGAAAVLKSAPRNHDAPPAMSDAQIRDLDIAFYQKRVRRDSYGAMDRVRLAALYLQRGRETGNGADVALAEDAARQSYALRKSRNTQALQILTTALLSEHRYQEAYDAASQLVRYDSSQVSARGTLAELALETGRYRQADTLFRSLSGASHRPSIAPRLARWMEINGQNERAHQLLLSARADAEHQWGMPREQLAWYNLRVGDIALRNGRLGEADDAFKAGLRANPGDYRVLSALARLAAMRHEWKAAIAYGEQGIETVLDPVTLGVMGDAWAALGDSAKSEEYYRVMEVAVLKQPGAFHRAWSLFLLDHGRHIPDVLAKVNEEIQTRKDIYGYDLLAWALHKSGQETAASEAMTHALAQGTRDAMLFYHAGMIARAKGAPAAARTYLERALETNPAFDPFGPDVARAVLDSLKLEGH